MKKMIWTVGAAVLFLVACDKNDNDNTVNYNTNNTDRTFVAQMAITNSAEIAAGQLAASRGNSTAVRSFGQMMVNDHTQAQADLHLAGNTAGLAVSDSVDAEHQAMMARLSSLSGYAFDTAYIHAQVAGHNMALGILQTEINGGSNLGLKAYASQYTPKVQGHLNMADSISRILQ